MRDVNITNPNTAHSIGQVEITSQKEGTEDDQGTSIIVVDDVGTGALNVVDHKP